MKYVLYVLAVVISAIIVFSAFAWLLGSMLSFGGSAIGFMSNLF